MASEHGIQLAVHLIQSHFGDLVAKVCECLLRKGPLPMGLIKRFTELSDNNIRKCLLVLIQHNCVQACSEEQEGGYGHDNRRSVQYIALFDNILHRPRFAKFMVLVSEKLGEECEKVLEGLLQHGRLTLEQVIERAKSNAHRGTFSPDPVRESFTELVNARFVERCPDPEPFLSLPSEEEKSLPAKIKKQRLLQRQSETIEERAIAVASHMDSKRFQVITDNRTEDDKDPSLLSGTNGKRKHDDFEEGGGDDSNYNKEILWRANFEEFIRCFRHKACVENVRSRLDDGAAIVCNAILEATKRQELRVKTESSAPLSLAMIHEEVMNSGTGRTMTLEHVRTSLAQLDCWPTGEDRVYSLGLSNIIEQAQNDEVDSIVLNRYGKDGKDGKDAYRIFRFLSKDCRFQETDKISEATFVEKKDTFKILYQLWKDEYLQMQGIHMPPQRKPPSISLWKINRKSLLTQVCDEMYHATLNVNRRGAYELEKEQEVLLLPRVGEVEIKVNRLRKIKELLDSSLMRLDDALMLFHDF